MNFASYGLLGYDKTGLFEPSTLWVIPELQILLTRKTPEGLIYFRHWSLDSYEEQPRNLKEKWF